MRTALNNVRLDVLAEEIKRLDTRIARLKTESREIVGTEDDCHRRQAELDGARDGMHRKLVAYFIESEVVRRPTARRDAA